MGKSKYFTQNFTLGFRFQNTQTFCFDRTLTGLHSEQFTFKVFLQMK